MSDAREALARLVRTLDAKSAEDQERLGRYWDRGLADGDVQEDVYRRTDAILAEFDVTPRGSSEQPGVYLCANPDAPDHPPHGIPLYIESWGTCDARPAPVVPDGPDVLREAEAALIRATKGDDPTAWAGTGWWHVHRLLAVVAQGVAAEQREQADDR